MKINVFRPGVVEISDGIIAERSQMDNRTKALEIFRCQIANVFSHRGRFPAIGHQRTLAEIAGIESGDLVAGLQQMRSHYRADIAVVASDQDIFWIVHS